MACGTLVPMADLKRLTRDWRRTGEAADKARLALALALLARIEAGTLQKDLVAETGINRETIRLLCNKARKHRARNANGSTAT